MMLINKLLATVGAIGVAVAQPSTALAQSDSNDSALADAPGSAPVLGVLGLLGVVFLVMAISDGDDGDDIPTSP